MQYFRLQFTANDANWFIAVPKGGVPIDIWACQRVANADPIPFQIYKDGSRVDFNEASHAIIVTSRRLAELLERLAPADIQIIPASIEGDDEQWFVVNVLARVDCIDHERSKITYYSDSHPESAGKPRGVLKLVLDADRIWNHHIFHPKDWEVVTVVSDTVKRAMEEMGTTGVDYWPVTQ
jgi:hypothetical protein